MKNRKILSVVLILCLACTMALFAACDKTKKTNTDDTGKKAEQVDNAKKDEIKIQVMDGDTKFVVVNTLKVADWKVTKEGFEVEGFYSDKELKTKIEAEEVAKTVKTVYVKFTEKVAEKPAYDKIDDVEFAAKTVDYDGNAQTIEATLKDFTITYEIKQGDTVVTEAINAGEYNVVASFASESYKTFTKEAKLTINKVEYSANKVALQAAACTFSNEAKDLKTVYSLTGDDAALFTAEYSFKLDTVTEAKNAGDYEVVATLTSTNYTDVTLNNTLTIAKADYDMSGVTYNNSEVYDGAEKSLLASNLPADVTATYSDNNKLTNVGSVNVTVTFAVVDADNYNVPAAKTVAFEITKATIDMSAVSFEDKTVVYNGKEQSLVIDGTLPKNVAVNYTTNTLTNVGSANAVAKFTVDSSVAANYNAIDDKTATLTITKATNEITVVDKTEFTTADFNTDALSADASFGTVKVEYKASDADDSTYSETAPTTDGNYSVRITVVGTDNYDGATKTISIVLDTPTAE